MTTPPDRRDTDWIRYASIENDPGEAVFSLPPALRQSWAADLSPDDPRMLRLADDPDLRVVHVVAYRLEKPPALAAAVAARYARAAAAPDERAVLAPELNTLLDLWCSRELPDDARAPLLAAARQVANRPLGAMVGELDGLLWAPTRTPWPVVVSLLAIATPEDCAGNLGRILAWRLEKAGRPAVAALATTHPAVVALLRATDNAHLQPLVREWLDGAAPAPPSPGRECGRARG